MSERSDGHSRFGGAFLKLQMVIAVSAIRI
jgi:hypothetical protein